MIPPPTDSRRKAAIDPRLRCARCKVDVVWPAGFGDKEKYRLGLLARGSPILAIRQAREQLGLALDDAKMLMTHVTRERHKCQYCRDDVPPGPSVCATCGAANLDW